AVVSRPGETTMGPTLQTAPADVPHAVAITDEDGRFVLAGVPASQDDGPISIRISCGEGDVRDASHVQKVVVRAGATVTAPDFVLSHGRLASALLHVVDERVARLGDVFVKRDGTYEIRGLPPPPWHVVASHWRYGGARQDAAFDVRDETKFVDLVVPDAAPPKIPKFATFEVELLDAAT